MKYPMQFKLEPELKKELLEISKKLKISMSSFIRIAIIEKLNKINK